MFHIAKTVASFLFSTEMVQVVLPGKCLWNKQKLLAILNQIIKNADTVRFHFISPFFMKKVKDNG